jgi:hypothetical protein
MNKTTEYKREVARKAAAAQGLDIDTRERVKALITNTPEGMTISGVFEHLNKSGTLVSYDRVLSIISKLKKSGEIVVLKVGKRGSIPNVYGKPAEGGEERR